MLVVLAVLGLVVGLVLARGPPRSAALEMRAATDAVAQALRLARARAIVTNQRVVVFDPAPARCIGAGEPRSLPAGFGASCDRDLRRRWRPAVNIRAGRSASCPMAARPAGASCWPGERQARVGVDWLTGRVTVADES